MGQIPLAVAGFKQGTGVWASGMPVTGPIDGQLLVDTGELDAGNYLFGITGSSSTDWVYDIQQRDATNSTNIDAQLRRPSAGNDDFLFPNKVTVAQGERLRVVMSGGTAGTVQMSIFAIPVG